MKAMRPRASKPAWNALTGRRLAWHHREGAIRHPDGGGSVALRERERGNKARVLVSRFVGPAY